MKNFYFLLALAMSSAMMQSQNITLTFDNPMITSDGVDNFYEVDVNVVRTSSSDFKMGVGEFYIDYNTDAFGTFIEDTTVDFDYVSGSVLSQQVGTFFNVYSTAIINDEDIDTFSISWQQIFSASSISANNVTDTPTILGRLRIQYVDVNEAPDVCFNVSGVDYDDSFFTACGPFTGAAVPANCTGLNAGTQIFDYDGSDCSGSVFSTTCLGTTTYTIAGGWDNNIPDSTMEAIILEDYNTADGNIEACELTVGGGATLTVAAGDYILVQEDILVNGLLEVEHQGSVVQVNNDAVVTNNGTINVLLDTPNLASRDFMIMGSPMTNESREEVWTDAFLVLDHHTGDFTPNAAVAAAFPLAENFADDNNNNWKTYSIGSINPAEGYLVRPQTVLGGAGGVFNYVHSEGTLNNGEINFSVLFNTTKNDSPNVLANPYASAISADDFINANAMVDELYFWEHLTPPSTGLPGAGAMNFSMEDISMYNLTGGTAAASDITGTVTAPNGVISTGQGFAIKANAAGTAVFNNGMRLTSGNTTLRSPEENRDRLWISIKNDLYNMQNTTLIGFSEKTSAGIDPSYDSRRIATVLSLFSHLEDGSEELGIQSRETFDAEIKIPLGFSSLMDDDLEYTISIAQLEGVNLEEATVYLEDTLLKTTTNLSETDYQFFSKIGTYSNRFILRFENEPVLAINEEPLESIRVYPNPAKEEFQIGNPLNLDLTEVSIFDVTGRLVMNTVLNGGQNSSIINVSELSRATYMVVIKGNDGEITKQLIKR